VEGRSERRRRGAEIGKKRKQKGLKAGGLSSKTKGVAQKGGPWPFHLRGKRKEQESRAGEKGEKEKREEKSGNL